MRVPLHLFAVVFSIVSLIPLHAQAATPPALSSPNASPEAHLGPAYFGNLAGAASVGASGNASYIIPLELPPGTHSMVPNLSLNYHSDVKNGVVGVGWFVEGLTSKINRCPQTIAQDGQSKGIDLSSDDKFCLDGHRLIAVSGTYGAPGTEYRTESDEFSRITSVGGTAGNPAYWTVERKDGITLTFGESSTAKMEAPGTSSTVVWCLEKVEDELGNYFEYSFDRPTTVTTAADSYLRTTRIDYTANDSQSLAAYASVQFDYETRDDAQTKYGLNGPMTTDKRISNIKTYVGATLVKDYQLTYEYSSATSLSRLTSLKACSNFGDCTETTNFTWSNSGVAIGNTQFTVGTPPGSMIIGAGDFDGDGITDMLKRYSNTNNQLLLTKINPSSGAVINYGYYENSQLDFAPGDMEFYVGDFNGDGKDDFLACPHQSSTESNCYIHLWDDTNWLSHTDHQFPRSYLGTLWSHDEIMVADINGDGRSDLLVQDVSPSETDVRTYLANADGSFTALNQLFTSPYVDPDYRIRLGDFNGDGLIDILAQGNWSLQSAISLAEQGGTYSTFNTLDPAYFQSPHLKNIKLGDFNGDGRTDALARKGQDTFILLADEDGHFSADTLVQTMGVNHFGYALNAFDFVLGDFNGDGRIDLLAQRDNGDGNPYLAYAEPDGTFPTATPQTWHLASVRWSSMNHHTGLPGTQIIVGEYNGDGRADFFAEYGGNWSGSGGWYMWTKFLHAGQDFPDQMLTATDGLGNVITFDYKPLTDSSVYTKGTGATYPEQDSISSRYVVSELRQSNGIGGESTITYTYEGLRTDVEGRGDLGFAKMTAVDASQNRTTITEYKQGFPYSKFPEKVEVRRTSDNQLLSSVDTTYGGHVEPQGTIFPYVDNRIEKRFDPVGGALLSTTTTTNHCDQYGNITDTTQVTVDHINGESFESKTISTFHVDITDWRVGQKTSDTQENKLNGVNDTSLNLTTTYTYDSNGQLSSSTRGAGLGNSIELTTTYAYDGFGNLTSETLSGPGITSRTSSTTWDARGQFPVSVTNALGHTETRIYDDRFGVITSQTGANGLVTTWSYNDFGQLDLETRPDGSSTQTSRHIDNGSGLTHSSYYVEVLTSGSPPARTFYDALGRERRSRSQSFDGSYVNTDTEYDNRGRTERSSEPYFDGLSPTWNTPTYDDSNRVVSMSAADSTQNSTTSYTAYSVTVTDNGGRTRTTHSNAVGQVMDVIDDLGTSTEFTYNQNGVRTSVINASGTAFQSTVTYTLDVLGRVLAQDDPDHGLYTYTYDALGQKLTEVTPKMAAASQSLSFTYDLLGRMTSRTEPEGTTTWTYDNSTGGNLGIGKLHSESMTSFSRTYEYASHGDGRPTKLTAAIGANTYVSETVYDSIGRVDTVTYPSSTSYTTGFQIQNTYNALGFLERVQDANSSNVYYQFLASNERGQMTQQWLGDGSTLTQGYEANSNRPTSQSTIVNSASLQHFTYAWDSNGNMTSRTDVQHGMTESFTYDALDRLTSAQVGSATLIDYGFDIVGNITEKSDVGDYSYNLTQPHAVGSITDGGNSDSYTYDANGNMGSSTDTDLPTSTWASYNKPTQIQKGSVTYDFSYGTDRARYKKVHTTASTTTTTHYLGDMEIIYGTGTEYRHLIRAAGTVIAVLKDTGTTSTDYLHRDHLIWVPLPPSPIQPARFKNGWPTMPGVNDVMRQIGMERPPPQSLGALPAMSTWMMWGLST